MIRSFRYRRFRPYCKARGRRGFPKNASRHPCAAWAPPSMAPHIFGKPLRPLAPDFMRADSSFSPGESLEEIQPLDQSSVLFSGANSNSQEVANPRLVEVTNDNALLSQLGGNIGARLPWVASKNKVRF